jgi:helicase
MKTEELINKGIPQIFIEKLKQKKINELNPAQIKAIKQGLLENKNMLICTPTGSGKTAIATLAIIKKLSQEKGKAAYIVPLKALANEKYKTYKELFQTTGFKTEISTGDLDSKDEKLGNYDLLILTVEKMDSLIRHNTKWIKEIKTIIIDEIHLLNDITRGPTLEVLLTILKKKFPKTQLIGLSATIGNPKELAEWLNAELVIDDWRPVPLKKGVYLKGEIEFIED